MGKSRIADFMDNAADRPYRELVEHHLGRQSTDQLHRAALGEVSALPELLRGEAMTYIDAVNERVGYDREFWSRATCKDAFDLFIGMARRHFTVMVELEAGDPTLELEDDLAFALFQIPTLSFAYSASTQRTQREFMGIRKGLFG